MNATELNEKSEAVSVVWSRKRKPTKYNNENLQSSQDIT